MFISLKATGSGDYGVGGTKNYLNKKYLCNRYEVTRLYCACGKCLVCMPPPLPNWSSSGSNSEHLKHFWNKYLLFFYQDLSNFDKIYYLDLLYENSDNDIPIANYYRTSNYIKHISSFPDICLVKLSLNFYLLINTTTLHFFRF